MKTKKFVAILFAVVIFTLSFTACSSEPTHSMQITAVSPYIDLEKAEEYGANLTVGSEKLPVSFVTQLLTAPEDSNDSASQLTYSTTMMKIISQVSAKEIDIILCDINNAQSFADYEIFMSLEDIFTEEELKELDSSKFISYKEKDDEGNLTGNMTSAMGIDVSHVEEFSKFMSSEKVVCHIISNTKNKELAKEYMLSLVK